MITPILLCGGSGTRLWPLSRKSFPKQFAPLLGCESLFRATILRLSGPGFAAPLVVTADDFRFLVAEELAAAGITPQALMVEPQPRGTGPAVLAAALLAAETDPETLLLVAPSDHVVPDGEAFRARTAAGAAAARSGRIITFGIKPLRAETGYGWLELTGPAETGAPQPLAGFTEKPPAELAAEMLASGRHLWNSGIFLMTAATAVAAFRAHAPALIGPVEAALAGAARDLGFLRLDRAAWEEAQDISLDNAVMEKAGNLSVLPFLAEWSDLGGWEAVWKAMRPDAAGVATSGPATAIDCTDTLLRSETPGQELVGIGLKGIVAVALPDAVLVIDKARTQEVRLAVSALAAKSAPQAESFARDHRPWGWFETLASGTRFQVKRIVVKPGAALSLQTHVHRAEHWVVVTGTARVTIGETVRLVSENQSVYVPLGERHRLENPGKLPMVLIEVQTGAYLGEDDIQRIEDDYARDPSPR